MSETDSSSPPSGIALFDLDGTLLAWDCQLLFRHHVLHREPWRGIFIVVFLLLLPLAGLLGSARMKRVFLCFLWRMSPARIKRHADDFAARVVTSVYPELRAELERHRAAGHCLILSSASPEIYVSQIGRILGFDHSLGTVVEFDRFFPRLQNHKGQAKVERLRALLPASWFDSEGKLLRSHGYTDSTADLPMLGLCQSVTVVNPKPVLAAMADRRGWKIVRPDRPWHGGAGYAVRAIALLSGIGRDPGGIGKSTGSLGE